MNFFKNNFINKIKKIFVKDTNINEIFDDIEEILIKADVGIKITIELIEKLRKNKGSKDELFAILKQELFKMLPAESAPLNNKKIILIIGVNGSGKTTSIAKLSNILKQDNKRVCIAAADTFRAAAIDQLEIWANRVGVEIIKQEPGSDPSAVVHDAISHLLNNKKDILLIDTAGRLHTKINLVEELKKIKRTIAKRIDENQIETIILLDAVSGQNSLEQAKIFSKEINVDSIFLSKLDSSAKGGFIFSIAKELSLPVRFVGVGEKPEDIINFSKNDFIEALFEENSIAHR